MLGWQESEREGGWTNAPFLVSISTKHLSGVIYSPFATFMSHVGDKKLFVITMFTYLALMYYIQLHVETLTYCLVFRSSPAPPFKSIERQ